MRCVRNQKFSLCEGNEWKWIDSAKCHLHFINDNRIYYRWLWYILQIYVFAIALLQLYTQTYMYTYIFKVSLALSWWNIFDLALIQNIICLRQVYTKSFAIVFVWIYDCMQIGVFILLQLCLFYEPSLLFQIFSSVNLYI